jgi:glycine dehydrogenase subunit 1
MKSNKGDLHMGSFVPVTDQDRKEMLSAIGINSVEDLFGQLPQEVILKEGLNLPGGMSEMEVCKKMEDIAAKNTVFPVMFRGAGAYRHYIPSIVKSVLSKETLYTAYTPYQAEISQGILQSIFEYQTMICELTGMDTANASVYDGASAAAEAVAMSRDRKKNRAFVSAAVHPQVMETIKTYCFGNGMELTVIPEKDGITDLDFLKEHLDSQAACVYIQHPNYYGSLEPAEEIGNITREANARYIMGVNPISLGIIKTPAEYGADIAVGEGQPLGLPLAFGGPYIGFMSCTKELIRKLPGRIVGETVDSNGKTGYVLTLQAREQHIRREKALSNICSNQALCALAVTVYLSAMGAEGLKQTAIQCMSKAHYMAKQLEAIGYPVVNCGEFFHEFVTISKIPAEQVLGILEEHGILGGYPLTGERAGQILWCCTEMNAKDDIDRVIGILKEV